MATVLVMALIGAALSSACGGDAGKVAFPEEIAVDGGRIGGRTDGGLHVFLGVPYAAPPIGDLRWRPPQPVEPWQGVRACTSYGPACPQPGGLMNAGPLGVGATSEDCLYLNVWTPARSPGERLPVMVWIHGGGFTSGAGSQSLYDGASLARRGVVLVSVNYRLGPFGFLAHPSLSRESSAGVSGNYGLRDQVAALEWVRRNIAAFGGDPERVTAFGESAGAMSVCYLMTSADAEGLFQRAIVQSGPFDGGASGMGAVRTLAAAERFGRRYAADLGLGRSADAAALRAVPAARLVAVAASSGLDETEGASFAPVVDGDLLPDPPAAVFARADQAPVPLIVGANADEADLFLAGGMSASDARRLLERAYGPALGEAEKLFPAARYGGKLEALSRLATVLGFWSPARFAAGAARRAGAPSYLYLFTRVPDVALARQLGAFHGLELPYVFGNGVLALDMTSGVDGAVSEAMMDAWTSFAATGDPNDPGGDLPEWPEYDPGTRRYLEFGDEIAVGQRYYDAAADLADRLRTRRFGVQE